MERVQFVYIRGSNSNVFSPFPKVLFYFLLFFVFFCTFCILCPTKCQISQLCWWHKYISPYQFPFWLASVLGWHWPIGCLRWVSWPLTFRSVQWWHFPPLNLCPYLINGDLIKFVGNSIYDLGFTFICNFCPLLHIETACCQYIKLLGFISSISLDLLLLSPLKSFYWSLICLILEYNSVLWNLNISITSGMFERVQRKFFKMVAFRLNISCFLHDYSPILLAAGVTGEHSFLSKFLSNQINSSSLITEMNFYISLRLTQFSVSFLIPHLHPISF